MPVDLEQYSLPEDQATWTARHWLVYLVREAGDLPTHVALGISAVILQHGQVVMAALEESGMLELIGETPVAQAVQDLTADEESAIVPA